MTYSVSIIFATRCSLKTKFKNWYCNKVFHPIPTPFQLDNDQSKVSRNRASLQPYQGLEKNLIEQGKSRLLWMTILSTTYKMTTGEAPLKAAGWITSILLWDKSLIRRQKYNKLSGSWFLVMWYLKRYVQSEMLDVSYAIWFPFIRPENENLTFARYEKICVIGFDKTLPSIQGRLNYQWG